MTKVRIITIFGDGWSEPQFEFVDPSVSLEAFARLYWIELSERPARLTGDASFRFDWKPELPVRIHIAL